MATDEEIAKLLVDSWEELRLSLKQLYIEGGMSPEDADDKATRVVALALRHGKVITP